jgi:hypothetical protein
MTCLNIRERIVYSREKRNRNYANNKKLCENEMRNLPSRFSNLIIVNSNKKDEMKAIWGHDKCRPNFSLETSKKKRRTENRELRNTNN